MRACMRRKFAVALSALVPLLATRSLADPRYTLVDEPVYIIVHNDRHGNNLCSIDIHLWVSGPKREYCVRKLEAATHVARFEWWLQVDRERRRTD